MHCPHTSYILYFQKGVWIVFKENKTKKGLKIKILV